MNKIGHLTITVLAFLFLSIPPISAMYAGSSGSSGLYPEAASPEVVSEETVVLLHGALKTAFSMERLDRAFAAKGYRTLNWDYDARNFTVQENAGKLDSLIRTRGIHRTRTHFVTHSIGGLVVRYYLEEYTLPHPGRFVMISPPNQGSYLATELQDFPPFKWFYRESVQNLLTGQDAFAPNAGIPDTEFGIIAGGTGGKRGFTWYLPGDDDGVLSVEQTKLKGAEDFILLNHVHANIVIQDDTIIQALHFIEHGGFSRQPKHRNTIP